MLKVLVRFIYVSLIFDEKFWFAVNHVESARC